MFQIVPKPRNTLLTCLRRSLTIRQLWYTRLSDYLISQGYELCPCMLNYEVLLQIARVTVYVVNTNLTKTPEELEQNYLAPKDGI